MRSRNSGDSDSSCSSEFARPFVDLVEEYVREERRERPALRRAFRPFLHDPVRHDPRFEIAANEREHPMVRDPLAQLPQEHIVMDPIEELLQIDLDHPAPATLHGALRLTHRVMGAAPRPKAITGLRERGIESRLQDL